MSEKVEDKDLLAVVVDGRNQAEIIAAHVEDGDRFAAFHLRLIGVGKHPAGFDEILPRAGEHQPGPIVQGTAGLGKPGGVVAQGESLDQSHSEDNMSSPWPVCQTPDSLLWILAAEFVPPNHSPQTADGQMPGKSFVVKLAERLRF